MQGNIRDSFNGMDNKWCCKTTSEHCKTVGHMNKTCIGKAISLQEQCPNNEKNHICNHYPDDPHRNYLHSFAAAGAKI